MPESDGNIGYGTKLRYGDTAMAVNTLIGEIFDITPPGLSVAKAEFTNNDSDDYVEEYKPGMITLGDVTLSMNFVPSEWQAMWDLGMSRAEKYFEIEYPDGEVEPFFGFVMNVSRSVPTKDRMTAQVTICVKSVDDIEAS